ncbi:MAG: O-acetylserine/cysteine exporter [Spirochaetae bacterium HGW-Spirochaetae-3]|jgi:O-acetylserine/cysteine efflux transporter|nr:MAG: O-acetylserine/cysteine exporter [Spirochaetae bacterium HGW-Spirochaetae-3]
MNARNDGRLSATGLLGALLVATVWGFNFTIVKIGLADIPPLFLLSLRFALSAFPAMLFIRRPKAPLAALAAYGLLLGVGQFGFLFTALKLGAPAGLSSVILQSQAFFTALLAAVFLKERIRITSVAGMAVAATGLAIVAGGGSLAGMTLPLVGMILAAAFFWSCANVLVRRLPGTGGLELMVWSSVFPPIPLLALSLWLEGPESIRSALSHPTFAWLGSLVYIVAGASLIGYGIWNHLILRHGAGKIAPFSLLVPVVGVSAAALVLGERFGARDAAAAALVLVGLLMHVYGGRAIDAFRTKRAR